MQASTPKSVKILIWTLALVSLLAPVSTFILNHYFDLSGPSQWLALSRAGLVRGWIWGPFTYFLIYSSGLGISLSLLISLFFHLLILWFTSAEIANRFGTRSFLLFFLGGALFAGLLAAPLLLLFSSPSIIVGSSPPLYALMTVWAMLYPDLEFTLFFMLRLSGKKLVALFIGIALLITLSSGQFIPFFADLFGIGWGLLIGSLIWKLPLPLGLTRRKRVHSDKIIDISVVQEGDEAFMDRMLDKITAKGEGSLTKRERERMNQISSRKNRK